MFAFLFVIPRVSLDLPFERPLSEGDLSPEAHRRFQVFSPGFNPKTRRRRKSI
jgi:hypothetical protein